MVYIYLLTELHAYKTIYTLGEIMAGAILSGIHSAMPRTAFHGFAHALRPVAHVQTQRAEVPRTQAVTRDVMQNPHRELVMSHAGAAFWASQGMKEDERSKKVGFEPHDEKKT